MMDWAKARPTGSLFVQLLTLTGLTQTGTSAVTFSNNATAFDSSVGSATDVIRVTGRFFEPGSFSNPAGFDYAALFETCAVASSCGMFSRVAVAAFRPLTTMIFGVQVPMPDFRAALTLEDGAGTASN